MKALATGVLCCLVWAAGAPPARAASDENRSTFSVHFENDLFGDTDQQYTSGVKLAWLSPDLKRYADDERVPSWLRRYVRPLLFFDQRQGGDERLASRNVIVSLGQSIFTPRDLERFDLVEDDRPYAGWLYAGVGFRHRDPTVMDTLELQLGVIGSVSMAEQTQVLVHRLRDIDKPNGWRHQLENEPTLGVTYERKWRAFDRGGQSGMGFDLIPHLGAALGNAYVFAAAGAEARLGWNLPPDFGDPLIRPGGVTSPPRIWSGLRRWSVYAFAFVDGRAVGRDIFVDGNTFADSHSVDRRTLVADLAVGASLVAERFKLTFATVLRTKEFDTQEDDHRFGSITLSYSY